MGAIALGILGAVLIGGGAAMKSSEASKKGKALREAEDMWLPDTPGEHTRDYFSEMLGYAPTASKLANELSDSDFDQVMRLREKGLPGIGNATKGALEAITPFLRGELPKGVLDAFSATGAASSVGLGFGGSGFGALNSGLFGARGAMGGMQFGFGLLPALMGTLPNINSPASASFLQAIMTPAQRTQSQLQFRQQQLGLRSIASGMQGGGDIWGGAMQQIGGIALGGAVGGGGMGGMMGGAAGGGMGGGGGAGGSGTGMTSPNYITPLP